MSHRKSKAEWVAVAKERDRLHKAIKPPKREPDLPEDLCDDCGMPLPEDCECCPTGEHNPGDPNCVCDFAEPGDRGRIIE